MYRFLAVIFVTVWLAVTIAPTESSAQSCVNSSPNFTAGGSVFGRIATQWNQYFNTKVDATNGTLCNPTIVGGSLPAIGTLTFGDGLTSTPNPVTAIGTAGLAPIADGTLLGNVSGGAAVPVGLSPTTTLKSLGVGRTYVYAANYGVVCNGGATDNTAELQAAIDATVALNLSDWAGSGHGTLVLPAGICDVSSALSVTSGITILGTGAYQGPSNAGGSIIRTTSATANVFEVASNTAVAFAHFSIHSSVTKTAGAGIHVTGASAYNFGSKFIDLRIIGMYDGVHLINGFGYTIRDSQIFDFEHTGIWQEGSDTYSDGALRYPVITGNLIFPFNTVATAHAGIEINGAGGGYITSNTIEGGDYGILVGIEHAPTGTLTIGDNSIATNAISNISVNQSVANKIYANVTIRNNKFAQIATNTLTNNSIYIGAGTTVTTPRWVMNVIIEGNTWTYNVASVSATVPALINIVDGVGISIANNTFDTRGVGPYHAMSITGDALRVKIGGGNVMTAPLAGYGLFGAMNWDAVKTDVFNPNLLLNAAMSVDQLNEGAAIAYSTGGTAYCVDGWYNQIAATAGQTATCQRSTDATVGSGYSLLTTVTASGATAATDYARVVQPISADTIANFGYGTAAAKTTYLSYRIKSSITGTFGFRLANVANNRSFIGTCTIATADAWTQCNVVIPGDTAGTWVVTGTDKAAQLDFILAAGSTRNTGTAGAWFVGASTLTTSAQSQLTETNGATFRVASVKWEAGDTPSTFVLPLFSGELQKAQRFYAKTFPQGVAPAASAGLAGALGAVGASTTIGTISATWRYPVNMNCAAPTIVTYNPSAANANWRNVTDAADAVVSVDPSTAKGATGVEITEQTTAIIVASRYYIHATASCRL